MRKGGVGCPAQVSLHFSHSPIPRPHTTRQHITDCSQQQAHLLPLDEVGDDLLRKHQLLHARLLAGDGAPADEGNRTATGGFSLGWWRTGRWCRANGSQPARVAASWTSQAGQPASQPPRHPNSQPASRPTREANSRPASQPINQAARQQQPAARDQAHFSTMYLKYHSSRSRCRAPTTSSWPSCASGGGETNKNQVISAV